MLLQFKRLLAERDLCGLKQMMTMSPDFFFHYPCDTVDGSGIFRWICSEGPDDPEIISYFIGLDVNLMDESGWHAIHYAALFGKPNLVLYLLNNVPECAKLTASVVGRSVLDICLYKQMICCFAVLIDRGVTIHGYHVSDWATDFLKQLQEARHFARRRAVIVCGLLRCRACVMRGNGVDILRMIARCIWSYRGLVSD